MPSSEPRVAGLSDAEVATLESLDLIDGHPFYTMHFVGAYALDLASMEAGGSLTGAHTPARATASSSGIWTCSLFAALGSDPDVLYGRNFDWDPSPALLLFTDPPGQYASVSMVDLAYLVDEHDAIGLADLPIEGRSALLRSPYWPFDGMNEHGLIVGMAAVPDSPLPHDPDKRTVDSLLVIRLMLDTARDVEEALRVLESVNLRWGDGPPLHYLIADASGRAALVEFVDGEMIVMRNELVWHLATNHLRAGTELGAGSGCWRYDLLSDRLEQAEGMLSFDGAMNLLRLVSQPNTQWSVVYGAHTRRIDVAMGRRHDAVHTFHLRVREPQVASRRHE